MQRKIEAIIQKHLAPSSDYIYGFADLTGLTGNGFGDFRYGISIGKKLNDRIVDSLTEGPTMKYFSHYPQMNTDLAALTVSISKDLNDQGYATISVEPSVATDQLDTVYQETLRTPLSHKMVATRAGLGWIGKTDLFISKKFGPRLRLVTILIDKPLSSKLRPIDKSRCGTCRLCTDACPVGASTGQLWDITVDRDEFFDAFKCRSQCAEFGRTRLQMDARVCGICVSVCPIGR